jgi:hypothetical protein
MDPCSKVDPVKFLFIILLSSFQLVSSSFTFFFFPANPCWSLAQPFISHLFFFISFLQLQRQREELEDAGAAWTLAAGRRWRRTESSAVSCTLQRRWHEWWRGLDGGGDGMAGLL